MESVKGDGVGKGELMSISICWSWGNKEEVSPLKVGYEGSCVVLMLSAAIADERSCDMALDNGSGLMYPINEDGFGDGDTIPIWLTSRKERSPFRSSAVIPFPSLWVSRQSSQYRFSKSSSVWDHGR